MQVSCAKEPYKRDNILQKRPTLWVKSTRFYLCPSLFKWIPAPHSQKVLLTLSTHQLVFEEITLLACENFTLPVFENFTLPVFEDFTGMHSFQRISCPSYTKSPFDFINTSTSIWRFYSTSIWRFYSTSMWKLYSTSMWRLYWYAQFSNKFLPFIHKKSFGLLSTHLLVFEDFTLLAFEEFTLLVCAHFTWYVPQSSNNDFTAPHSQIVVLTLWTHRLVFEDFTLLVFEDFTLLVCKFFTLLVFEDFTLLVFEDFTLLVCNDFTLLEFENFTLLVFEDFTLLVYEDFLFTGMPLSLQLKTLLTLMQKKVFF